MALRWRKNPRETGLRAVGAGPRGSALYLDGNYDDWIASINADGGTWMGPFKGWYWVAPSNEKLGIQHYNSYPEIFETEKEAKDKAMAYVKNAMKEKNEQTN